VAKGAKAIGLGDEAVPGGTAGLDDGWVILKHPQREKALPQVEPDPLDRVDLGYRAEDGPA
jgi:hypothetical protein